jgi:hypothetical protein
MSRKVIEGKKGWGWTGRLEGLGVAGIGKNGRAIMRSIYPVGTLYGVDRQRG